MKVLFLSRHGDGADLCSRMILDGNQVRLYIDHLLYKDSHDGIVPKVPTWQAGMAWGPDLVVFDDNDLNSVWRQIRGRVPIFGGSDLAHRLEEDRAYGHQVMKQVGLDPLESLSVKTSQDAIKHLKAHPVRHVIKPTGKKVEKHHMIVGEDEDGSDAIVLLERLQKQVPFETLEIEERKVGVEVGLSAWCAGPLGMVGPVNVNFEHKRSHDRETGYLTGEMGCYDEDTEVLTRSGWKFWRDVVASDELGTLSNGFLTFQVPSKLVRYDVDTEMIGWRNRAIDVLVTPNHQMYLASQTSARRRRPDFKFVSAEAAKESQYLIPRRSMWAGREDKYFTVPLYRHHRGKGFQDRPSIEIPMADWSAFLGVYVAEGSGGNMESSRSINIAQSNPRKALEIEKILKRLPFQYRRLRDSFHIYSAQLTDCIRGLGLGTAPDKHVPQHIKDSTPEVISRFLYGFGLGDGHLNANGYRTFYTCSKVLSDDIQELLLKIGRVGNIKVRSPRKVPSFIGGRAIISDRPQYEVVERVIKGDSWIDSRDRYTIPYRGRVYCATVSSHILMVRRNGKAYWCGNTLSKYSEDPNLPLFKDTLAKVNTFLKRQDYRGQIDLNLIVDGEGCWPLEWTPRLGKPSCFLEDELHVTPWSELFYALAHGRDPNLKVHYDWAVGVCLCAFGFPFETEYNRCSKDLPIQGIHETNMRSVHLVNGKGGRNDFRTSGGYGEILVATGRGHEIDHAKRRAYEVLSQVKVPNSYCRWDIGDKISPWLLEHRDILPLEESQPLLP